MRLADTHIGFDSKLHDSTVTYSDWTNPYIALDDLAIDTICTPERFVRTMAANGIATAQNDFSGSRLLINTQSGVQARFCAMTDFAASMEHETPVRTAEVYLHRITTVKLA